MDKTGSSFLILLLGVVPLWGQGNFEKGISHYKQGQYAKAIEEFEQIVKTSPDYESGYRILGDSYLKLKNYDKAAEAFQNALRLKSDRYVSHFGLALAYYNSGQYRNAIATLLKGERYARSPLEQYQLYQTRGSAYYNIREFEKAISDLHKATSIQRGNLQDVLQLGIAYYEVGDFTQSEKFLRQALTLSPETSEAELFLSRLQYQRAIRAIETGRHQEAAHLLTSYVSSHPQDADAWFNLGLAQLFAPNLERAERAFLRSVELAPDNWEAFNRLGYIYEKKKNYSQALHNYQRAFAIHKDPRIRESVERLQERLRQSVQ